MKKSIIFSFVLLAYLFSGCGNYRTYRTNSASDKKQAEAEGMKFFNDLKNENNIKIENWFADEFKSGIPGFRNLIKERQSSWGKLMDFNIENIFTKVVKSNKGDTTLYEIYAHTVYEFAEGYDRISLESINEKPLKMVGYDFTMKDMYEASLLKLNELQPQYEKLVTAALNGDKETVLYFCDGDEEYTNDVLALKDKIVTKDSKVSSIEYINGFFHTRGGTKKEAWGSLAYLVHTNKNDTCIVVCDVMKDADDKDYYLDYIYMGPSIYVNNQSDKQLLETMVKDVVEMIDKTKAEKLHAVMHNEVKGDYEESSKELKAILEEYKNYGPYEETVSTLTLRTDDESYINFWAVIKKGDKYMEFHFQPDDSGNYKLYAIKSF